MKTIMVRLTPRASSDRIGDLMVMPNGERRLMVYVTSIPEQCKANKALIKLLADHLSIAPSRLQIIRGKKHRDKTIIIMQPLD